MASNPKTTNAPYKHKREHGTALGRSISADTTGCVDYWHIAEMEREIWGHTWPNINSPVPLDTETDRTLHEIGLQLNVQSPPPTTAPWWQDVENPPPEL